MSYFPPRLFLPVLRVELHPPLPRFFRFPPPVPSLFGIPFMIPPKKLLVKFGIVLYNTLITYFTPKETLWQTQI